MDLSGVGEFFGQNRNVVATIGSSITFFTGWWILRTDKNALTTLWVWTYESYFMTGIIFILWKIDSAVRCNIGEYPTLEFKDSYHTCGVFATLAFFFINSVSNSRLNDDFYEGVRFNFNMVYQIILKFRDALDLVEQKYGSLLGFFALSDLSSVSLTHFGRLPLYQQYKVIFSLVMDFVWRLRIQYPDSFPRRP